MKIVITTKRELQNPHLELDVDLEKDTARIIIRHLCPKCSGYGCHNRSGGCDNVITLAPEDVLDTLGADAKPVLELLFKTILNGKL
jgi:hypothetical protein